MELQDLADQEGLWWDSWAEWMAGHFLWYLFWGNSSSSQQLREDKVGKWWQCVWVCLSFFWLLVCQTSDLRTYLDAIVSCKDTAFANLILSSWLEESPQCFEFGLAPAGIGEGSKKLVRETGLAAALLQVFGLCLYPACSSFCRNILPVFLWWLVLITSCTAVAQGERSGSSVGASFPWNRASGKNFEPISAMLCFSSLFPTMLYLNHGYFWKICRRHSWFYKDSSWKPV